ncbi:hypothetical protein N9C19_00860, partial [bacterium]|nr:hypothetical protein [bacterium]
MAKKVEQVENNRIILDYDQTKNRSEFLDLFQNNFPGASYVNGALNINLNGVGLNLLIKNVTYLGHPHPVFKKRIQIPGTWKTQMQEVDSVIVGVYTFNSKQLYVIFSNKDFAFNRINNSSAHCYTQDLLDAADHGRFEKEDKKGNHIIILDESNFKDYLRDLSKRMKTFDSILELSKWQRVHLKTTTQKQFEKLKTISEMSADEREGLSLNENTGLRYEYAVYYHLINEDEKKLFKSVIERHKDSVIINKIIESIDDSELDKLQASEIYLATQNDAVGPSDIVLKTKNGSYKGISVKYNNNNIFNPSPSHFISDERIDMLDDRLKHYCEKYIDDMNVKFGPVSNWFRKGKRSEITNKFIDELRDAVIKEWDTKTKKYKRSILREFLHSDSPIKYDVLTLSKGFKIAYDSPYEIEVGSNTIGLEKQSGQYISFVINGQEVAKMQVKFNNGILEEGTEKKFDFEDEGVKMKMGSFGSWNFSI